MGVGWRDGGWGGWWGRVGSRRWVKASIQTQRAVLYLQYGTQIDTIHKEGQDCHQEQFRTQCNPIKARQGNEIHPPGLTVLL